MANQEESTKGDLSHSSDSRSPLSSGVGDAGGRISRPRRRRILVKIIIVLVAAIVLLATGEILLRLGVGTAAVSGYPLYSLVPDSFTGARYAPNLRLRLAYGEKSKPFRFTTNSMGFRSREVSWTKPPGTFRILCLGDGFTEGFGVNDDQTFPYYLEEIVRGIDKNIEVINAGQSGCGLPECLALIRGYAARLAPDLVILALNAGNDLATSEPSGTLPRHGMAYGARCDRAVAGRLRCSLADRWILVRNPDSRGAALDRWFHRNSLLYRLLSEEALHVRLCRAAMQNLGWIEEKSPRTLAVSESQPAQQFLKEAQKDVEARSEAFLRDLSEIKAIAIGINAQLFVLVIPNRSSLPRFESLWNAPSERLHASWEEQLGRPVGPDDVDKNLPNEQLRQVVGRALVASANLTNLAVEAARYDEFYQLTYAAPGGHFSPDDNLYVALVLCGALTDGRLLGPAITVDKVKAVWRREFSRIQTPFFPPDPPEVKGGQLVLWGFGRGTVASSLETTGGAAGRYEVQGLFSPMLNVQPPCEKAKKGDFIAFRLPLGNRPTTDLLALATEVCFPAMDARLNEAVRFSVSVGDRVIMERSFVAGAQGRWEPLVLGLPVKENATTLTIRVEATRDFDRAPTGEFPLVLRMRRLRIFRFSDRHLMETVLANQ